MLKKQLGIVFIITLAFLSGCASHKKSINVDSETAVVDPYEGFNRSMYNFNGNLDTYLLKPVVDGYKWIAPDIVETGVSNVFSNMKGINVFLNDFLQGKLNQGAQDAGRFLINSTLGIGGIFDVATYAGLKQNDEDFGQTLAVWGVPRGPYVVLPVLGPSTFRDIPGSVIDTATNPVTYLGWPVAAAAALDSRAAADSSLQFIDEAAVDRYVFTREGYLQFREYLASDGKQDNLENELLEDYDEEDESLMTSLEELQENVKVSKADQTQTQESIKENNINNQAQVTNLSGSGKPNTSKVTHEDQPNSPAFNKALRSFQKATQTYKRASDDLELIKKGDQQKP